MHLLNLTFICIECMCMRRCVMHACICTYIVHVFVRVRMCIKAHMWMCVYVCMYARLYLRGCVCLCTYTVVCSFLFIYLFIIKCLILIIYVTTLFTLIVSLSHHEAFEYFINFVFFRLKFNLRFYFKKKRNIYMNIFYVFEKLIIPLFFFIISFVPFHIIR